MPSKLILWFFFDPLWIGDLISLMFFLVFLKSDPFDLLGETRFLEQCRWGIALATNSFQTPKWHRTQKTRLKSTTGWEPRSRKTAKVRVSLVSRVRKREGVAGWSGWVVLETLQRPSGVEANW
jgi:hypothetical protein